MRIHQLSNFGLAAALALAFSSAHASDGTITFAGQLQTSTCAVSAASANQTVTLPTLATTNLNTAGQTGGTTAFAIAVSGCPTGVGAPTTFTTFFETNSNVDMNNGNLKSTGTATGVQLRLSNATGGAIRLDKPTGSQNVTATSLSAGAGTANYFAEYFATGATSAGTVASSITYSMVYN